MSIEKNIERIADSLETLIQVLTTIQQQPVTTTKSRSKKSAPASTDTGPVEEPTPEPVSEPKQTTQSVVEDDWGAELAEEQTTETETFSHEPKDEKAKVKAEELAARGFSDVKENFYECLNSIRDSFGKDVDGGKAKAREIGYKILEGTIGTKTLTELTLPKEKFKEFTYQVEVARGHFFSK